MKATQVSGADLKQASTPSASVLSYNVGSEIQDIAYASIDSCEADQNPFSDGLFSREHIRVTLDAEKVRNFLDCCDWIGAHPALEIQQALDLAFDSVIALAIAQKEAR